MKKIFTLLLLFVATLSSYAQHGALYFTGPSTFKAFTATVEVKSDTLALSLNVENMTADITLPEMYYADMMLTVPSFTIKDIPFEGSYASGGYTFSSDSYTATAIDGAGEEKTYTGTALAATYDHKAQEFAIETTFTYGKMPFPISYSFKGNYNRVLTGISTLSAEEGSSDHIYDLQGRRIAQPQRGLLYIKNGKKYIAK